MTAPGSHVLVQAIMSAIDDYAERDAIRPVTVSSDDADVSALARECNHGSKKSKELRPKIIRGIQIKKPDVLRMVRNALSRDTIRKRGYSMAAFSQKLIIPTAKATAVKKGDTRVQTCSTQGRDSKNSFLIFSTRDGAL